ncbi:alpha/beta hydrolase [Catenovulum sediminis]|uniref:alpha/beta hydrolase n=1 Tax=Catenovulum sediminis TaxID=1740262 RepID=UPI00117EDBF2|nr:alpha/beta hydrolase [Catenovulum sediminis]
MKIPTKNAHIIKNLLCISLLIWSLILCQALSAFPVDAYAVSDNYTLEERYERYKVKHPELRYPNAVMSPGIKIYFERRYLKANRQSESEGEGEGEKSSQPLNRDLHLDIFAPQTHNNNKTTFVLIHGGGWRSGNKSHMYSLANTLVSYGHAAIIPEYRLSIEAQYPAALVDLEQALFWIKNNAEHYALNTNNITIVGGSSGGQLAALLAFKNAGKFSNIKSIVSLDGVLSLTDPQALKYENKNGERSAAALWLGGAYEQIPHLWQQASPVNYIDAESPHLLFISSGQKRFSAGFETAKERLKAVGKNAEIMRFENTIHTFWLFEPWLTQVAKKLNEFVEKTP